MCGVHAFSTNSPYRRPQPPVYRDISMNSPNVLTRTLWGPFSLAEWLRGPNSFF